MTTISAAAAVSSDLGVGARRQSWIGVDYFEALRHHQQADSTTGAAEQLRRIPASISNILCVRWSPDGRQLAASTSDGCIGLYEAGTGRCLQFIGATASGSPATSIRFRPDLVSDPAGQHVLVAAYTNGHVTEFNFRTGDKVRHLVEADNQILALDYAGDGQRFVTAGKDRAVRLYDEATGALMRALAGHTNRVFGVRCDPDDPNLIVSGGWDDTVRIWDVRAGGAEPAVGLVFGPHVCGDAVDLRGTELLAGSWADRDQVQIWDRRAIRADRPPLARLDSCQTMVYTAQFSTVGPLRIGLGGTKPNQVRVVDRTGPAGPDASAAGGGLGPDRFCGVTDGSYTSQFSPASHEFASAGAGNVIRIVDAQHGRCREISAVGFRNVPKW